MYKANCFKPARATKNRLVETSGLIIGLFTDVGPSVSIS